MYWSRWQTRRPSAPPTSIVMRGEFVTRSYHRSRQHDRGTPGKRSDLKDGVARALGALIKPHKRFLMEHRLRSDLLREPGEKAARSDRSFICSVWRSIWNIRNLVQRLQELGWTAGSQRADQLWW